MYIINSYILQYLLCIGLAFTNNPFIFRYFLLKSLAFTKCISQYLLSIDFPLSINSIYHQNICFAISTTVDVTFIINPKFLALSSTKGVTFQNSPYILIYLLPIGIALKLTHIFCNHCLIYFAISSIERSPCSPLKCLRSHSPHVYL